MQAATLGSQVRAPVAAATRTRNVATSAALLAFAGGAPRFAFAAAHARTAAAGRAWTYVCKVCASVLPAWHKRMA